MANGEGKEFIECATKLLLASHEDESEVDLLSRAMELSHEVTKEAAADICGHTGLGCNPECHQGCAREIREMSAVAARISSRLEREK